MRKRGVPVLPENDTSTIEEPADLVESAIRQNEVELDLEISTSIETNINADQPLDTQDHPFRVMNYVT